MSKFKQDADFIWADLSALDLSSAKSFYSNVFSWKFTRDKDNQSEEYYISSAGSDLVSGIFDMPEFFRKINMPSFWMSYLAVEDIDGVVARAKKIKGVVVEVEPTEFAGGKISLIRDPAGAGFTVYEGVGLGKKGDGSKTGHVVWNELIVDSVDKVKDFYEQVFGFKLVKDKDYDGVRFKVMNPDGKEIAGIEELAEEYRGDKVYWVPFFSVNSLDSFSANVQQAGGEVAYRQDSPYGNIALVYDSQSAAFGAVETGGMGAVNFKYKTLIALIVVAIAALYDWQWFWGIAFLLWLVPDIKSGATFLVETVYRDQNPIWYWLIIATWATMASWLIYAGLPG